jgi:hypothetical protein
MTSLVTLARQAERVGVRFVLLLPFLLGTVEVVGDALHFVGGLDAFESADQLQISALLPLREG